MKTISGQKMSTAGQVLRAKRESLKKSIDELASETKIKKEYLIDIENDRFENFSNQVFLTGFIKIYASALGLNVENILAVHRRSIKAPLKKEIKLNRPQSYSKNGVKEIISPKTAIFSILAIFLISVLMYIGYQLYNFQRTPLLEVNEPNSDTTVSAETIEVEGKTDLENRVTLNDKELKTDSEGKFSTEFKLNEGKNLLVIKASRKNNESKSSQLIRTITYEPKEEEETQPEVSAPVVNEVTITIINAQTWAQIIVDDMQKTGEVLEPGFTQTYTIAKSLFINSGINGNVVMKFNGQDFPITSNPLECTIDNTIQPAQLNCK